jgi:hypothetical protein
MFCEKVCFGEIIVFNRRATLEMLSLRGDGQPAAEHLKVHGEPNLLRNAEITGFSLFVIRISTNMAEIFLSFEIPDMCAHHHFLLRKSNQSESLCKSGSVNSGCVDTNNSFNSH